MADVIGSGDFTQAASLRAVAVSEVSRPSGTVSERPVEEDSASNTQSNEQQAQAAAEQQVVASAEEATDPLERAAERLQQVLGANDVERNLRLRISLDEENGRFIYQSIDEETGEIVRQFPPEEIIELMRENFGSAQGVAVDDTV